MKLDKQHQIWEAAAGKDENREVLKHVLIERTSETAGVAIAADGFILAVVPVELDPEDVVGLIPAYVLKDAATKAAKNWSGVVLLRETEFRYCGKNDWVSIPRVKDVGQFPPYQRIIPNRPPGPQPKTLGVFALSPDRFLQACKAIGVNGDLGAPKVTAPNGRKCAFLVESIAPDSRGIPNAPFAVIMPMKGDKMPEEGLPANDPENGSEQVIGLQSNVQHLLTECDQLRTRLADAEQRARTMAQAADEYRELLHNAQQVPAPVAGGAPEQAPARKSRTPELLETVDTLTLVFGKKPREDTKAAIKALGFTWAATLQWAAPNTSGLREQVQQALAA